jgi:hypothetical protein
MAFDYLRVPGLRGSLLLLLLAMHVPNAFSLLTSAVKETVCGAGKTHVFQSLPQSLTASMKPHRYIVQCGAEACGDSLPRLAQDVSAPDDIGIVGLERRQQLIEAVAYHLVDLWVGRYCLGAVAICVGIDFGAISSMTRLADHAARSIG